MKILITGGKGMLGRTLQKELVCDNEIVVADLPEWDILDADAFTEKTIAAAPDVVIHCAAMTKVDDCETKRDLAFKLNEDGSRNVALACKAAGARLIAISTDYVFSGEPPREPWAWSETDIPRPRTVYGASKFAGEQMIHMILPDAAILRIAWLYGAGGPSFVHAMAALADGGRRSVKVVDDQRGNPTSALAVSRELRAILARPELRGTFHATCEGEATWADFAREFFRLSGRDCAVEPCTTDEFPRPAPRPRNSRLEKARLREEGLPAMPDWHDALAEFVAGGL